MSMTKILGYEPKVIDVPIEHPQVKFNYGDALHSKPSKLSALPDSKKNAQRFPVAPASAEKILQTQSHASENHQAPLTAAVTATTLLRTAATHPLAPVPLKVVGALGLGAWAIGDWLKSYLPATARSGVSSLPLLGRPPGSSGGVLVYPEERRNTSHEIPSSRGIDARYLSGDLKGRERFNFDLGWTTHPGGSRLSDDISQVKKGRQTLNPPQQRDNVLLSEEETKYANDVREAISKAPEVLAQQIVEDMQFYRHEDFRDGGFTDLFHYRPKIKVNGNVVDERVDVLKALNLNYGDYGVNGLYKQPGMFRGKSAGSLHIDIMLDTSGYPLERVFGNDVKLVQAALESIQTRYGNYPEVVHLNLPGWQSDAMSWQFDKVFKSSIRKASVDGWDLDGLLQSGAVEKTIALPEFQNFMNDIHAHPVMDMISKHGYEVSIVLPNDELNSGNSIFLHNRKLIKVRQEREGR